ncbi:hypothetical protein BDR26DRAFT_862863 [Obelidium mucronatum]|nr:hypothetical protein BDR26DRAFT_862863 [Obelidium mucronatum]
MIAQSNGSPVTKPLHVVFIVDVTPSMGPQIKGVKSAITAFCAVERPNVQISIFTYTESSSGCYVSKSKPGLSNAELLAYVKSIEINNPVEFPGLKTGGNDNPENVCAAVAQLTMVFDSFDNVLAFVITDAPPHHRCFGERKMQRNEAKWLRSHGFQSTDVFEVLNHVIEFTNCTIVPILYQARDFSAWTWYQQAALLTGGLCLVPTSTSSTVLAQGMVHILQTMQEIATNRQPSEELAQRTAENLIGFNILPLDSDSTPLECDVETLEMLTASSTHACAIDADAVFRLLKITCDRFSGKQSLKRVKSVDGNVIVESVKVMLLSVLKGLGKENLFSKEVYEATIASLENTFARPNGGADINKMDRIMLEKLQNVSFEGATDEEYPVTCVVSLESVGEFLGGLSRLPKTPKTERDLVLWMEAVMQMCMVRLVNIKFPVDNKGESDFHDAWSSRINQISTATSLSASAAIKLRNNSLASIYLDPLSREEFTSALILAHPNDPVLTFAYKILTCLPSLHGLIQGYLVSGGLKIFPSLSPGIQASSLLFLIGQTTLEKKDNEGSLCHGINAPPALWEVIRVMIWSLRQSCTPTTSAVVASIRAGKGLNPADAFSKLLAATITYMHHRGDALTAEETKNLFIELYEEVSAGSIATFNYSIEKDIRYGEFANYGNHIAPLKIANCFVRMEDLTDEWFDPIKSLHPAEQFARGNVGAPTDLLDRLKAVIHKSKLCVKTMELMKKIGVVLQADVKQENPSNAFKGVVQVEDEKLVEIMIESMLLGKRAGRYILDDSVSPPEWVRNRQPIAMEDLGRKLVAEVYKPLMKDWNQARIDWSQEKLIDAFDATLEKIEDSTTEQASVALASIHVCLHQKQYKLSRMDALKVLARVPIHLLKTVGVSIVTGDWTTEPTCGLIKSKAVLEKIFAKTGDEEIVALIKNAVGSRAVASRVTTNRHGHSISLKYPGIYGWTEKYHTDRLASKKQPKEMSNILDKMKAFTRMKENAMQKCANKRDAESYRLLFSQFTELNQFSKAFVLVGCGEFGKLKKEKK